MFPFSLSKNASDVYGPRRRRPRLEQLEQRTLLTFFRVVDVPDALAMQEATADVNYTPDKQPQAEMSVTAQAHPAGTGDHAGFFQIGSERAAFVVATSPEPGQEIGDPIAVSFEFSYRARLQFVLDFQPVVGSNLDFFGRLEAGDDSQDLMEGSFNTDKGFGSEATDDQVLLLNQRVGDPIRIVLSIQGEAHAAEPHFQIWVDFTGTFTFRDDASNGATGRRTERAALVDVLAQDRLVQQRLGAMTLAGQPAGLAPPAPDRVDFQEPLALATRGPAAGPHHAAAAATAVGDPFALSTLDFAAEVA